MRNLAVLTKAEGVTGRTWSATGVNDYITLSSFISLTKEARGAAGNLAWLDPLKTSVPGDVMTMELAEKIAKFKFRDAANSESHAPPVWPSNSNIPIALARF